MSGADTPHTWTARRPRYSSTTRSNDFDAIVILCCRLRWAGAFVGQSILHSSPLNYLIRNCGLVCRHVTNRVAVAIQHNLSMIDDHLPALPFTLLLSFLLAVRRSRPIVINCSYCYSRGGGGDEGTTNGVPALQRKRFLSPPSRISTKG